MSAGVFACLLDGLVEAFLVELVAAREEVRRVRTCTTAERHDLEAKVADLEAALDQARREGQEAAETALALRRRVAELEPPAPPEAPAPRAFRPHRIDLSKEQLGTFRAVGPTSERRLGSVVWSFRCSECGEVRMWTANNVSAFRKRPGGVRCECQGGAPRARTGRVPTRMTVYKPETNGLEDEDTAELGGAGDDLDGLLERSMRLAEGDASLQALAARADRPRRREDVPDGEFAEVGENEDRDEDEDDGELEELDFEEATG